MDPDLGGQRPGGRGLADEALGVGSVGGVENGLALLANGRGEAEVDHGGRHHADAGVAMFVVVPRNCLKARLSSSPPKRSGKSGRYFMVRNWLSE